MILALAGQLRNCRMNLKNSGDSIQLNEVTQSTAPASQRSWVRNPVESPEFFRFMRQLLKIVQQVRRSYLHLINE